MNELETLLRQQWVKRDGSTDESMATYCLKSSKYIDMGNYYLDIGDSKPTIDSDLWYDDETDGPDASKFEAFRAYNMRGKRFDLDEVTEGTRKVYIYGKYTTDRTNGKLKGWLTARIGDEPTHVGEYREATADDIMAIKQGLSEIQQDFEKRLKTYWKRYSNKVHARGYWANR